MDGVVFGRAVKSSTTDNEVPDYSYGQLQVYTMNINKKLGSVLEMAQSPYFELQQNNFRNDNKGRRN